MPSHPNSHWLLENCTFCHLKLFSFGNLFISLSLFQAKHVCFPIANGGVIRWKLENRREMEAEKKPALVLILLHVQSRGPTRHCSCMILSQQPLDGCGIHSRFLSLCAINAFDCTALVGPPISWAHPMCSATTRAWEG